MQNLDSIECPLKLLDDRIGSLYGMDLKGGSRAMEIHCFQPEAPYGLLCLPTVTEKGKKTHFYPIFSANKLIMAQMVLLSFFPAPSISQQSCEVVQAKRACLAKVHPMHFMEKWTCLSPGAHLILQKCSL